MAFMVHHLKVDDFDTWNSSSMKIRSAANKRQRATACSEASTTRARSSQGWSSTRRPAWAATISSSRRSRGSTALSAPSASSAHFGSA
jgi:hypothetical protein